MKRNAQWHKRCRSVLSALLALVLLFGLVPAGSLAAEAETAEAIKVDFKEFVQQAARTQPAWWTALRDTDVEGIKMIGSGYGSAPTEAEYAAFRAMQAELAAAGVWNIKEGSPSFDSEYNGRKIFLNSTDDNYGLRFYPDILQATDDRSDLILSVQAPQAGVYHFDLTVLNEASDPTVAQVNGTMGRAYGNIYVNDILVYENYFFASDADKTVTLRLGAVELNEGENTVRIKVTRDDSGVNTTSRRAVNLKSMEFIPLNGVQVELSRTKTLDLRATYLPFDAQLASTTHTVSVDDPAVVEVSMEPDGDLVFTGRELGTTTLTVKKGSAVVCTFPVSVVEATTPENGAYFTVDGFKAVLLSYGENADGQVVCYKDGSPMTEEETAAAGAVYFVSSDADVAAVDPATGDITTVGEGIATVTAYVLMDGVVTSDSASVTVTDDTDLAALSLESAVDYVGVGNTMQMTVQGRKASGAKADLRDIALAFRVDDTAKASISDAGRLEGIAAGEVTVTVSVGVQGVEIKDERTVQVVENSELADGDVIFDFTNGRVLYAQDASLEKNGYALVMDQCYKGGAALTYMTKVGLQQTTPVGEKLVLDILIAKDGWYCPETTGGLYAYGSISDIFLDGDYMGTIDYTTGNGGPYSAYAQLNTVYLTAGVHRVELVSTKNGDIFLGELIFRCAKAPQSVTLQAEDKTLLAGQTAKAELTAVDSNGRTVSLKPVTAVPAYSNYYTLTSSAPSVVEVSGDTLTAKAAGTATVTARGMWLDQTIEKQFTVTVTAGKIAAAFLTGEKTTLKPNGGSVQLTFSAVGVDGNAVSVDTVTYQSDDPAVAAVSDKGLVTVGAEEGSARITASVADGDQTVTASCWITVTEGKTAPTVYTDKERENAQYNANTYDWAISMKKNAVAKADYYVEHLDQIYSMWIREGLPRSTRVGVMNTGDSYRYCRYCKTDLVAKYGAYPWIVDPIENPWKVTCPACKRDFPSNDFESYYKSGLDAQGYFSADRADDAYLVNELYPEMGEGWGVDDGFGYKSGIIPAGYTREDLHTYIAYYLHCVFDELGSSKHSMIGILDALRGAYLYTGDETYGTAGAILLDRMAEIYPEYHRSNFSAIYPNSDGNSGSFGRIVGCIWEADSIAPTLAKAADAFWPSMDNDEVVAYLRENAVFKGEDAAAITPEAIRENVDNGILLEIKKGCESSDISGNFGMQQSAIAYAAVALDRQPETGEMLDWAFRYGDRKLENGKYSADGGAVLYHLVELVDRDGFGNEVSYQYNALWCSEMLELADALKGYTDEYDLWHNPKFVNMFSAMSRLTVCGRLTPQIGEAGFVQSTHRQFNVEQMTTAFSSTGNHDLARALYAGNGNTAKGLHADIFTEDPETGLQEQIRRIVNADGVWDYSESNMMSGFGIAILREGPATYIKDVNEGEFSDYWMYFGPTHSSHARLEALAIDIEAFGLGLSSSMGYPLVVSAESAERMQWVYNTVSHNTVVVDDHGQSTLRNGGFPLHFEDAGRVKVMDAEASNAYPETDIYRRTVVTVEGEQGVHYAVDFFRVLGGSEHVYSFHGATTVDPTLEGLEPIAQPMGTYAGPDIPYGDYRVSGAVDPSLNLGSGYSWLDGVSRDQSPGTTFCVDWAIEDFHDYVPGSDGIHLKLTMLSEEPMTEVALANGRAPQNGRNPEHLEYLLVRRSGEVGMDTLFSSVIEPYKDESGIASAELVQMQLLEGTESVTDRAAAVKVTLTSGRVDYVVYATNPDCLYSIDGGVFNFQGFAGVATYENNVMTYSWGSEVTTLGTAITEAQARVTGTVQSFTEELADRYTLTVTMEEAVTAEELEGRYIFVENDGQRNAAYRIYGAEVTGNTAVLDLYTQTLIRGYADKENMDKGYVYNLSAGDRYTIPLSSEGSCSHRNSVSYVCNGDGTHTVVRTCIYCKQITSTSAAACKDGTDADTKCDRCKQELPVQIATAEELLAFAARVNSGDNTPDAILLADIDLTDVTWTPIGTNDAPYKGVFTGGGHTVSGMQLVYRGSGESCRLGLFGTLSGAAVRGLTVEGSIALSGVPSAESAVGGLAGYVQNTVIEDCINAVTITGEVGVEGYHNLGGLAGYAAGLTMTRCGNEADLSALGYHMGGLVGYVAAASVQTRISESYNHGDLEGCKYLGGLVGTLCGSTAAATPNTVTDCYNSGSFATYDTLGNANASGGGLIGRAISAYIKVENAYVSGRAAEGDSIIAGSVIAATADDFDNIYYLEGAGTDRALGKSVTAEALCGAEMAQVLGKAFQQAKNQPPVLTWECAHADSSLTCFDNGDGTHTVSFTCAECGLAEVQTEYCIDADSNDTCDKCGGLLSVDEFTFAGANMTLGNELHLNFLFAKDQLDAEGSYTAVVTKYDGDGNVEWTTNVASADWEVYKGGYYKITAAVASGQMCDEICVTILNAAGRQVGETYTDSVRSYAMRMLEKDLADNIKTMLVDMLNYGAEAQLVFGYNTDDLANAKLTEAQKALATVGVTYEDCRENIKNAYGSNLSLVDRIKLGVYFYDLPADTTGMYGTVTFTRHNGDVVTDELTADDLRSFNTTAVKNLCQVVIDQIVLADARVPVTVTVYHADGTVYGSVVDSVEGYIARNSVKLAAQKGLHEAIMKFADSAYDYFMNR